MEKFSKEHIHQLKKMYTETNDPYKCSALKAAMEALRKQIPMKIQEIHADEYFCPACGAENICDGTVVDDEYCPVCGQAIDP